MKSIAIFASGNGSNCENIIRYFSSSEIAHVAVVITNNPSARVVERAEHLGTPVKVIQKSDFLNSNIILPILKSCNIDLIVLAGFLLFIPEYLVNAYKHKIVNIHPSLLPKYGGRGMYGMHVHKAVKENGEDESGITIHFVSDEYDKGEIIAQYSTAISASDSAEDIAAKVHELEYAFYPKAIEKILNEEE